MLGRAILCFLMTCLFASAAHAERYYVRDQDQYAQALSSIRAGDVIVLADGEWRDFEIEIAGEGREDAPITLISETRGGVILTGQSNLRIGGEYILVTGLVFRDGYSPTGEVISFRRDSNDLARNSRVTEVVIDHFSKADRNETDYWVAIYGRGNRFDHNHLVGKTNRGVTLAVRLDTEESRSNNHRIDHNYFGPRPVLGSNGGETLRVGTSHYAEYDSNTLIENNVFDRTDGEVEIISSKSGGNIFRGNLFLNSRGALTLRHGDGNLVERNIFLGNGKDHTGGIRVINRRQTVRGNYMEGLRGSGFASALTVMNGVPNSPANRYVQVEDAVIEHNTIVDSLRVTLGAGADEERSAAPASSVMRGNLFQGLEESSPLFQVDANLSGIEMVGNVLIGNGQPGIPSSLPAARPAQLLRAENGLLYPVDPELRGAGARRDLQVIALDEVGVSWYEKPNADGPFGTGQRTQVAAGAENLLAALRGAQDGDTLVLAPGDYVVERTLALDKAVTISGQTGAEGEQAVLGFARPTLFELREGGMLRLENLQIQGGFAPDSVGNSVIRTGGQPIRGNLQIELDGVTVRDLVVNRNFNVITLGPATFADRVTITNSTFDSISGSVISAASERDDQGRYNVEYLDIEASIFRDITGPLGHVYRGGRDESTFGPHVRVLRSIFENVGVAEAGALQLHGVQFTDIAENIFTGSGALRITHTVGTPSTAVRHNSFTDTPPPVVEELIFPGAPRIELEGNSHDSEECE